MDTILSYFQGDYINKESHISIVMHMFYQMLAKVVYTIKYYNTELYTIKTKMEIFYV